MKSKNLELQKIIKATQLLKGKQVIIFGSQAKEKGKKGSDLDLCILIKKGEDPLKFQRQFRLKLWELGYQWIWPLDIHVYPEDFFNDRLSLQDPFIKEIKKGVKIYDQSNI
ncbi:MAG: nucleotidyltransferase domain-containing protein [Microgenomates group bacterium]